MTARITRSTSSFCCATPPPSRSTPSSKRCRSMAGRAPVAGSERRGLPYYAFTGGPMASRGSSTAVPRIAPPRAHRCPAAAEDLRKPLEQRQFSRLDGALRRRRAARATAISTGSPSRRSGADASSRVPSPAGRIGMTPATPRNSDGSAGICQTCPGLRWRGARGAGGGADRRHARGAGLPACGLFPMALRPDDGGARPRGFPLAPAASAVCMASVLWSGGARRQLRAGIQLLLTFVIAILVARRLRPGAFLSGLILVLAAIVALSIATGSYRSDTGALTGYFASKNAMGAAAALLAVAAAGQVGRPGRRAGRGARWSSASARAGWCCRNPWGRSWPWRSASAPIPSCRSCAG
jgi:hypothetical protein